MPAAEAASLPLLHAPFSLLRQHRLSRASLRHAHWLTTCRASRLNSSAASTAERGKAHEGVRASETSPGLDFGRPERFAERPCVQAASGSRG